MNKKIILVAVLVFCGAWLSVSAQRDTARKQTIDITSSYKPVLRNPVKINFSATNLPADTTRLLAPYSVPTQTLFYTYQSTSLSPLALSQDTSMETGTRNFVKLGFGNYTTPYASAGFSFGDGKTSLVNIYADYISSKGNIENQDYARVNIKGSGSYYTTKNEVYGSVGMTQQDYYLYGYDHMLHNYSKSEVLQRLQDVTLKGGFRNKEKNESGINYNPNAEINIFSNQDRLTESSLMLEAPVEKTFNDLLSVKVAVKADITSYSSKNLPVNVDFNNNIFQISPELIYTNESLNVHAGVSPAWDNGKLNVLPNIYGEFRLPGGSLLVQGGLVGRFIKNTYRNLSMINPYLQTITFQENTKEVELYGGIKTSLGKHFNFAAKAGYINYHDLPLYINDTATDYKSFLLVNESQVTDFRVHADLSYVNQDKFTITGGLTFNGYTGLNDNDKAWGTIPLEINASLRWWAYKQVLIKSDFRAFSGGPYLLANNEHRTLSGAGDLSAGVEFAINKNFSAWLDLNNIFNNKYERWHNYPVYGLNLLAGMIYRF